MTGDSVLEQLRWPNDFDTLLTMRSLATDPDADLEAFESSHATSGRRGDRCQPGWLSSSAVADQLIRQARETTDTAVRADLYGRLQDVLDRDVPAWPIWYDTDWSAMADRVRGPDGPIDPSQPRFDWDVGALDAGRARSGVRSDRVIMRPRPSDHAPRSCSPIRA